MRVPQSVLPLRLPPQPLYTDDYPPILFYCANFEDCPHINSMKFKKLYMFCEIRLLIKIIQNIILIKFNVLNVLIYILINKIQRSMIKIQTQK